MAMLVYGQFDVVRVPRILMMSQHAPRPMLLQLLLFAVGGLIMLSTGAWILPGVPFIIAIKLLHSHGLFQQLQQTAAYKTAAGAAQHLSRELLVDPRDQALMVVSLSCAASTSGLSLLLVVQHLLRPGQTHLPVVLLRQAVMAGTLVLMFTAKHQESHRRKAIYKHKLAQATLQRINEWWTGIFCGSVPEIDHCGHGFVHHRNNMEADDWGNSHLDRASLFQFCQWAVTAGLWHNSGLGLLWEFHQSHCYSLLQQTAFGMAAYYSFAAATLVLAGPRLFVLLFVWPFVANVGFASVVNWGWHIFADPAAPLNYAASTITVMDWAGDMFSEGLYLTHHLRPAAHYSEVRQLYDANRDYYIANNSLLLTRSDPLETWAASMLHCWGYFADRLVDFSGQMTPQQKRAFVRYRTRPIGSKPADPLEAAAVAAAAGAAAKAAARLNLAKAAGSHVLKPRYAGRVSVTAVE